MRELYQGILQVGVGFYHLCHRNYPGTVKMLRRGLPRLRDLPENCQGIRSTELYEASRIVHDRVVELGPERIDEFDLSALPKIALAGC